MKVPQSLLKLITKFISPPPLFLAGIITNHLPSPFSLHPVIAQISSTFPFSLVSSPPLPPPHQQTTEGKKNKWTNGAMSADHPLQSPLPPTLPSIDRFVLSIHRHKKRKPIAFCFSLPFMEEKELGSVKREDEEEGIGGGRTG